MELDSLGSGLAHLDVLLPEITVARERLVDRPAGAPTRSAVAAKESMTEREREILLIQRKKSGARAGSPVDVSNFGLSMKAQWRTAVLRLQQNVRIPDASQVFMDF